MADSRLFFASPMLLLFLSSNSVLILLFFFFLEILYPESAYSVGTSIYLMINVPNSYLTVSIPGISSINEVVFGF